jgi:hypothetical protein
MFVLSNQGGGIHGHLAIILTQARYDVMAGLGKTWDHPINPSITPNILGNSTPQFQIADSNCAFAANIVKWNTYLATSPH